MEAGTRDNSTSTRPSMTIMNYFKYDADREPRFEVRNTLLVLAVLVTTATYQAALNPPGGLWQDNSNQTAGTSVLATNKRSSYIAFIFFNSVGFFTSLLMIMNLTGGFPLRLDFGIAIFALGCTYTTSIGALDPDRERAIYFYVLLVVVPGIAAFATAYRRNKIEIPAMNPATPRPPV